MMWLWLCAAVLFGVVEAVTAGLVSVWFAVGSVGAFFAALGGLNVTVQLVIFAAVSAAALAVTRPLVARFGRERHVPTNLDRVIGRSASVTEDIDNDASTGAVYVDGKTWTARSAGGEVIPAGTKVEIQRMEGVKLFVKKSEEKVEVVS
ncbi:MAG: NfeD family protein [Oscillibacter sp.]|jgi:membrane protein implicated in regulation of membrane protease activity|nr:NfeD family protein [uncultured Oscillibacter sp.]MCI8813245.1 NfeD family protein [Oscillibacter sp.]